VSPLRSVTLVTGASSGIGYALARRLARGGRPVAVMARRTDRLKALVEEIEAEGGRALAAPADVLDRAAVEAAVGRVEHGLGPVECLVANAGGGELTFVDTFDAARVQATVELNVVGVANCIGAVLPRMLARGRGHLVATGSLAGRRGLPTLAAYSAAKAAVDNLMESLRIDLRGRAIDVTVIAPGPVRLKSKSKKSRLLSLDVEDAAARIERAMARRQRRSEFPFWVALAVRLASWLPAPLYEAMLAGRGRRPKPPKVEQAP
jgi:NADP-dependent 3-hydroxy acid dehydrogenase YdfG